jgi:hypothetical protein
MLSTPQLWTVRAISTSIQREQGNSENSRYQDQLDQAGQLCRDGGVGNALIHHSTITEYDHTHASCADAQNVLSITHTLHPRALELSMFATRVWRCIDYLHLYAGRRLFSPMDKRVRPMMEKVRGALFSMLLSQSGDARFPSGMRWLDLFAGTVRLSIS